MENFQKPNAGISVKSMKYMLMHKLASLLTQQQLAEKTQKKLDAPIMSSIIDEKLENAHSTHSKSGS